MELTSPIVVGVSRRTGSPEAVRWAAAEARLRNTTVLAVTAWRGPRPPAAPGGRPPAILPHDVGLRDCAVAHRCHIVHVHRGTADLLDGQVSQARDGLW